MRITHGSKVLGALIQHLESIVARGGSDLDLIGALEDELSGGDLFDAELSDERSAITKAREREAEVARGNRGADALKGASRGGIYLPHEIPDLAAGRATDPTWTSGESIRFLCFAVALRELDARTELRSIGAEDYASAVMELAMRVSRVKIRARVR